MIWYPTAYRLHPRTGFKTDVFVGLAEFESGTCEPISKLLRVKARERRVAFLRLHLNSIRGVPTTVLINAEDLNSPTVRPANEALRMVYTVR